MKIAIIGPQNTGKSTLLSDLLEEFPFYSTPIESYRDLVIQKNLRINQETTDESQRAIRDFLFEQIKENTNENIFFDRSIIDNFIYTSLAHRRGAVSEDLVEETYHMMMESFSYLDRLFFIPTAVSIGLLNDQLRDIDAKFIDQTNHCFIATLFDICHKNPIAIDAIAGNREERVAIAKRIISKGPH